MKNIFRTLAALAIVVSAASFASCSKEKPILPVIKITGQPVAPKAALTEGSIPADAMLTVTASATREAVLTYQWFSNSTATNMGGTAISGATAKDFTLPATLAEGPHHYYCVVSAKDAIAVPTNAVTVIVDAKPVITIDEAGQPTTPQTTLVEGEIPSGTKLTVTASVTEGATLTYQWYRNTSASNENGTAINGEIAKEFAIPTDLTAAAGPYYYYCVVGAEYATSVPTNVVTVTVDAKPAGMIINGVTWAAANVDAPGKFAAAPEAYGMYYQWGKNVGWSTTDPMTDSKNGTTWDATPYSGDSWTANPCPNGWRVPAKSDFQALTDKNKVDRAWTTQNDVKGWKFTDKTTPTQSIFLPAAGFRNTSGALAEQGQGGDYWHSTPYSSAGKGYDCYFYGSGLYPVSSNGYANGLSIRCVRQ